MRDVNASNGFGEEVEVCVRSRRQTAKVRVVEGVAQPLSRQTADVVRQSPVKALDGFGRFKRIRQKR